MRKVLIGAACAALLFGAVACEGNNDYDGCDRHHRSTTKHHKAPKSTTKKGSRK